MDELAKKILQDVVLEDIAPRAHNHSPVGHWTQAVLLERGAYLKKMARYGSGSATETIREYPQHTVMLSHLSRTGEAAMHQGFAHLIIVLAGGATLVTGGTMTRARITVPGETRGDSIEGGAKQELRTGDTVHIPAGIAHQILVAGDRAITCLIIKMQETPAAG